MFDGAASENTSSSARRLHPGVAKVQESSRTLNSTPLFDVWPTQVAVRPVNPDCKTLNRTPYNPKLREGAEYCLGAKLRRSDLCSLNRFRAGHSNKPGSLSEVPSLGLVKMFTVCQRWPVTTSCLQWLVFRMSFRGGWSKGARSPSNPHFSLILPKLPFNYPIKCF